MQSRNLNTHYDTASIIQSQSLELGLNKDITPLVPCIRVVYSLVFSTIASRLLLQL